MPVVVAGEYVGALDLFRAQPGQLDGEQISGAVVAAELAGIPLLDLLDADLQAAVGDPDSNAWAELQRAVAAPRSARPPACSSPNSGSNPPRRWCGCAPTPTRPAAAPPTSPATSSTADSGSRPTDAQRTKGRSVNMTETPRETRVLDAVVSLVDSLLDDFDVVDLLTELTERCAELLDVAAAGFLLADPLDQLRLLAATTEQARELELFQLQADEGPCVDCYATGQPVSVADLQRRGRSGGRGSFPPRSTPASPPCTPSRCARPASCWARSACSAPTPANSTTPTASSRRRSPTSPAWRSCRSTRPRPSTVMPQLRSALASRVIVEQAKGFLRETLDVSVEDAFTLLRSYARANGEHLTDVARRLMTDRRCPPGTDWRPYPNSPRRQRTLRRAAAHGRAAPPRPPAARPRCAA